MAAFRLRQLRGRHVRLLRRSYACICGIDCTSIEWGLVETIPAEIFPEHVRWCSRLMGCRGWTPRVKVLCIGTGCDFTRLPTFLQIDNLAQGRWWLAYGCAHVLFEGSVPLRNVLFHELTHALMHLMSGGFRFPRAFEEGYALLMDYCLGDKKDPRYAHSVMRAGQGRNGSLLPTQTMTIWEALTVSPRKYESREGYSGDSQLYQKLCLSGTWIVLWLTSMAEKREACGRVLPILRQRGVVDPEGVYRLLQEVTQMSASEMEASYRWFAVTAQPLRWPSVWPKD